MSTNVYISIGSNSDDRTEKIELAIDTLESAFTGFIISSLYQTPCCRGIGAPYLNAVASFQTAMSPDALNSYFKELEKKSGRSSDPELRHVNVPLDIDLVVYGNDILRQRDFDRMYFQKGYLELRNPRNIKIEDYFYNLPDERIALHPLAKRDSCKLLVCSESGIVADTNFENIGRYLPENSMLVYNNTKVINARLKFKKSTGSVIEIFCLEPDSPADYQMNFSSCEPVRWKCLVGNSKRWKSGSLFLPLTINSKQVTLAATRIRKEGADSIIEFTWEGPTVSFSDIIEKAGEIPIPPYLNRKTEESDFDDYQTVYSHVDGSVAAPTAGLHFTEELLDALSRQGIERRQVTLHVGAGTFQPVKSESIGEHPMHAEFIDVDKSLIRELAETNRPIVAVGTTTVRTLESLYHIGCQMATGIWHDELDQWYPYSTKHPRLSRREALLSIVDYLDKSNSADLVTTTRIIIAPGYSYRVVSDLITNFHQPGSTLLLLVAAIVGDKWQEIYEYALDHGYRFLSYGDACLFKIH